MYKCALLSDKRAESNHSCAQTMQFSFNSPEKTLSESKMGVLTVVI
jgi:hypothetical protein